MNMTRFWLVVTAVALSGDAQGREWTSADGRKLEAEFVTAAGDQVTLKRANDGRTFTLGLAALSAEDQAYVRGLTAKPAAAGEFRCDFEGADWQKLWNLGNPNLPRNFALISEAPMPNLKWETGNALEVTLKKGTHYGADFGYDFATDAGGEPESATLAYRICFAPDFNEEAVQGGKLPGFGGVYGDAGSAGKRVNGSDSWSARGAYWKPDSKGDIPIGFYVYHADMESDFGDTWYFSKALPRGKWHEVRLFIQLNSPATKPGGKGRADGILRGWVNGQRVFEKKDIRFRDVESLKIRNAWFHFYHGGGQPASADYKLWIDDVAIARGG